MGSALPGLGLPSKADIYAAALEGLVQVNDAILDRHPDIPPIYAAGVRFKPIPHDYWRRADQIAGEGWGDCDGLSAWRVAELRRTGEDPDARVGCYHTGPRKYHAIVIRGDDSIEDPSVKLGMRMRPTMPLTRGAMNRINGHWPGRPGGSEPASIQIVGWDDSGGESGDNVSTKIITLPNGESQAIIDIPLADGSAIVAKTTSAIDKATTIARAGNLLADTASVIAKNPLLLARLNPYTAAAVTLYSSPEVRRSPGSLADAGGGLLKKGAGGVKSTVNFFRSLF